MTEAVSVGVDPCPAAPGLPTPRGVQPGQDVDVDGVALTTLFQPIVDLATGDVVAQEALVRGPVGGLYRPDQLFAAARRTGRLVDFDRRCRRTALATAIAAGPASPPTLFLNVEPAGIPAQQVPSEAVRFMRGGRRVVLEFTERALTADPARVQAFAAILRDQGVAVALDDVGSHPSSLALMPFLRPEIVKLDMGLVHRPFDDEAARIVAAVGAYAQQNDATILVEGVETPEHERAARALGARLGQGFRYGAPAPLRPDPRASRFPDPMFASRPPRRPVHPSPFDLVAGACPTRSGSGAELLAAGEIVERRALTAEGPIVMIGSTIDGLPPPDHARRWVEASRHAALIVLFGAGTDPLPGVRGTHLAPDDPLCSDMAVVVVGPHVAKALVARPRDDGRFDYALVYDRDLTLEVAHSLMSRIVPAPSADL